MLEQPAFGPSGEEMPRPGVLTTPHPGKEDGCGTRSSAAHLPGRAG